MAQRDKSKARTWIEAGARRAPPLAWQSSGRLQTLAEALRASVAAEFAQAQLLPWIALAFACGTAAYFGVSREPVVGIVAPVAAILMTAAFFVRHTRAFVPIMLLSATVTGFAGAAIKTARVDHLVLQRPLYGVALKGFVEVREERERTDRFVIRVTEMQHDRQRITLDRVRLSVKKGTAPRVGEFVSLKARLQPPLAPLRPGGYDFAREMFFARIAASGFVMGAIRTEPTPTPAGWRLGYAATMQNLRDGIDARIRSVLGGDARAIATALLTGKRDAISTPVNDAMFVSGLGHVLSISGYHMAVVAGVVFFAVRALLALIPALTPAAPIKSWAALSALFAALFYLLLSGAEVATQRSFLMTAIVLLAIVFHRRAITFRTLALAALIVLVIAPEAVVHPSFQMSFAATLGLVALVERGMPLLLATPDDSRGARLALWGGREIAMLALASIVAGFATMPFAAYHFHRVTPYGVLANLAAMPVVSGIVMPAGLLGLVAIPFGLDGFFWRIMELGVGWMIAVSNWVAALPGAVGRVSAFGTVPLLMASAGLILIALLRTRLRLIGAGVLLCSVWLAAATPQPDILVSGDGETVAVRGRSARLSIIRGEANAFQIREWLAADADDRLPGAGSLGAGVSCDEAGCVAPLRNGRLVALSQRPDAFDDDCASAAVIVTAHPPPPDCRALVISRERLRDEGALALRIKDDGGVHTVAVRPTEMERPWYPRVAAASRSSQPSQTRPVDTTPADGDIRPDD